MNGTGIRAGMFTVTLCLLMSLSSPLGAKIHKWVDEDGNVHFGDSPPDNTRTRVVVVRPNVYATPSIDQLSEVFRGETVSSREVILYSTTWCGHCKKAKAYFAANGIAFTEYDVEHNAKGKRDYQRLGASGVPVILVGKQRLNGFSPSAFERIYKPSPST